uniref:Polycystin cation channel n=1 Tax=Musca domestica TaxID=7370 RepID=A0A1I8MDB2_MUSDO
MKRRGQKGVMFASTKFYTVSQLNVNPIRGEIKRYYGAGHVKNLSYERMINEEILETLKSSKWIDRGTRIVVVEFVLFNYNSLMFDNVKILAELPPVGGIVTSHQFQAVKLHSIWSDADYSVFIAAIIFYLMTTFYTFEEIGELITIGSVKYLKSVWNLLDISVLLMSYLSLIYNMFHHKYLNGILEKSKENPNHFWSIDKICFWNLLYIDMMGICVFLVWIKIFKYISINKTMLQFSTTLKRCAKDLCGFAVMFFIVFLAYAQLGLLIFGTSHPDFREFGISIITLMRMFLGDFEYELIEEANHILGPIYFLSYVLFVFFILLNMFLAIINDTYGTVKDEVNQGYSKFGPYLAKILQKCFWWRKKDPEHNILKHTNDSKGQLPLKDSNGHSSDTFYPMTNEGSLPEDDTLRLRISELIREYFEDLPFDGNRLQRVHLNAKENDDIRRTKSGIKTTTVKYDTDESVRSALLEILIYVIFLITTTIVATASRHLYMFYFNQTLEKLFTGREMETNYGVEVRFEELVTTADWWSFLQYKFLDDLHGEMLSSTENETFSLNNKTNGKDGLAKWQRVVLKDNILLGPPRLRQIRVKENTCHVNEAFLSLTNRITLLEDVLEQLIADMDLILRNIEGKQKRTSKKE